MWIFPDVLSITVEDVGFHKMNMEMLSALSKADFLGVKQAETSVGASSRRLYARSGDLLIAVDHDKKKRGPCWL